MTNAPKTAADPRSLIDRGTRMAIAPLLTAALLAVAAPAYADGMSPLQRWTRQQHLHGAWQAHDPDHDGIANRREYTLGTHPRRADTDRDGDEIEAVLDTCADSDLDDPGCTDPRIEPGALISSLELIDRDGERFATAIHLVPNSHR